MGIGGWEWAIILVIVLIVFGAGRLPDVLGQVGKGVKAFKDGTRDEPKEGDPPRKERAQIPENDELDDAATKDRTGASERRG